MAICRECKCFFALEEDSDRGDCVQRVIDPRQAYYKAKPVEAEQEATQCPSFQGRK
jgi:benzylsuccinate synthase